MSKQQKHLSLADQLSNLSGRRNPRGAPRRVPERTMPSVDDWIDDGVDHINIYEYGLTDLGKALSHGVQLSIKHSIFGSFATLENFWFWIKSNERTEALRTTTGPKLKRIAQNAGEGKVDNFRAIIADTNYQKIKQYQVILDELVLSELPFDCYYIDSKTKLRVRHNYTPWLVDVFNEIRTKLKLGQEPDFTKFLSVRDSEIYQFVTPTYLKRSVNSVAEPKNEQGQDEPKSGLASLLQSPAPAPTSDVVEQEQAAVEETKEDPSGQPPDSSTPTVSLPPYAQ